MNQLPAETLVFQEGDSVYTTSLVIAEKFGKRHGNVLRDIEALNFQRQENDGLGQLNFESATFLDQHGRLANLRFLQPDA
jgi:Rha family phage regulatory protein